MKEKVLNLFLILAVLIVTLASCEKEVIYVTEPSNATQGTRTNGSSDRDGTDPVYGPIKDADIPQPALTPPANPGVIKASETKSAGNITIANTSRQKQRIVNLGFKFSGDGAAAVDSVFYTIRGYQQIKLKVTDGLFAINGIVVPANTFTDVKLDYKLAKTIPTNVVEGSQIILSLNTFGSDIAGVNTPSSGTFPNPINLDKVSLVPNSDDGNDGGDNAGKYLDQDISHVVLTAPANVGTIKAGQMKLAGYATVANSSNIMRRIVNLGFKFEGAGAGAVDSVFYTLDGKQIVRMKVVDNGFKIETINLGPNTSAKLTLAYKIKPSVPTGISEGSQIILNLFSFSTELPKVNYPRSGILPDPINLDRVSLVPNDDGGDGGNDDGDGNDPQTTIIQTGWFSYLRTPALVAEKNTEADVMIHVIQLQMTGPGPARIRSIKFTNPYSAFNTVAGNDFKFMKDWGFDLNDRNRINFEVNVTNQNTFTVNFPVKDIPANGIYQRISIFAGVKNSGNRFDSGAFTHGKFGLKITSKSDIDIRDSAGNKIDLSKVNVWLDGTAIN